MINATLSKRLETVEILKTGRIFFAIAMIAFGIENFLFGYFVPGRAPAWPSTIAGGVVWAYLSGVIFIILGILIIIGRSARLAAILAAALIFVWALIRHIPILVADLKWGSELTQAGKALALFGGALAVAGSLPKIGRGIANKYSWIFNVTENFIVIGRFCLSIFLIICGIEHFIFIEFVQYLVPSWIPGPVFWSYFTGVALVAGGAGLMLKKTTRLAAALSGVMIFLWFIMLHIPRGIIINDQNEWTSVVEALAMSGIALVLAGAGEKGN